MLVVCYLLKYFMEISMFYIFQAIKKSLYGVGKEYIKSRLRDSAFTLYRDPD